MVSTDSDSLNSVTGVEVGYLKQVEQTWKMHRCFFPSKIGQKPAWLDPENLPRSEELQCTICEEPCVFLLQLYAPDESNDETFHRTLFVFCCRNPTCYKPNSSDCFRVFRCQLTKNNKYYSSEPPEYENPKYCERISEFAKVCNICGCRAPKACSRCSAVNYCSKQHQVLDWKHHKLICGKADKNSQANPNSQNLPFLFPEKEICIEDESIFESDTEPTPVVERNSEKSLSPTELEQFVNREHDKKFANFRQRISHAPDQVIRYDKGGEPLWCSDENVLSSDEVPKCTCGSTRQFEFQIMPQLLNNLDIQTTLDSPSIDWGVLAVYTCVNNCGSDDCVYKGEFIHKQDFTL